MLVSYNKIKHLSDIHSYFNVPADDFDSNSNTVAMRQKTGWMWEAAVNADYCVCFVDTNIHCAGYTMPPKEGDSTLGGMPSLVFFINSDTCFEDIERTWKHETIHIKQIIAGRLALRENECYWEGVKYELLPLPDISFSEGHPEFARQVIRVLQYYAQPWELEAQRGNWDTRSSTFRLCCKLIEKHQTCWKSTWNDKYRCNLIQRYGLYNAFLDLL